MKEQFDVAQLHESAEALRETSAAGSSLFFFKEKYNFLSLATNG